MCAMSPNQGEAMSPNQGETAVCGSSILCWMTGEVITGCRK